MDQQDFLAYALYGIVKGNNGWGNILDEKYSKFTDDLSAEQQEKIVQVGLWRKLRRNIKRVPFARDALASYYCTQDEKVPFLARSGIFMALAYFVMPIDFIPDILLALGFADDATVFALAFKGIGQYLAPRHYERADEALGNLERGHGT